MVKTQMAPRRRAEPGNPEWKRRAWRTRGILLAGLNSGKSSQLSDRHVLGYSNEMNETFSFVPNLSEHVSGENECSQIVLNFLTR